MKSILHLLIFTALIILINSCSKDEEQPSQRAQFIGTYAGTKTTMLVANGELVLYNVVNISQTIEKGEAEDEIIIGKGTESEFNASVDGTIFLISGHPKQFIDERTGMTLNFSITGQGVMNANNKLTVTYGSYVTVDKMEYKLTIVENLNKTTEN